MIAGWPSPRQLLTIGMHSMASAAGKEIAKYRHELEAIYRKIMAEHTESCGCDWHPDTINRLLCDLNASMESCHIRRKAVA